MTVSKVAKIQFLQIYFFQATWTILRKSSPGSWRSSRVRRSGTWTRTPWRCWSTSRTTSWSSSSTATRRSRRSLSPRSTPSTMRPRSLRSSWSRTETLRLQGRNQTVSYQRKFLRRNYGIFVLPAVVHFEDGVPNIYEGQKDFVLAWFFRKKSTCKIHIYHGWFLQCMWFSSFQYLYCFVLQEQPPMWPSSTGWRSRRQRLLLRRLGTTLKTK